MTDLRPLVRTSLACLAGAVGATAGAAELVQRDLTLELVEEPTHFSYTLTDPTTTRTGSDSFQQNIGLRVGGRYSFAGAGDASSLVVGAAIEVAQASYGSEGHFTQYGLRLHGGYGWAITDHWSIAANLGLGYVAANLDLQASNAFPGVAGSGNGYRYGLVVDGDYSISDTVTVMALVGYEGERVRVHGSGVNIDLAPAGVVAALGFAYRFSAAPRPVEGR